METRRLTHKRVHLMTDDEAAECEKVCYRTGQMGEALRRIRDRGIKDGTALLVRTVEGELAGWALVFNDRWYDGPVAHFYVKPKFRRNGIGRRLAEAVGRRVPECGVLPWNDASHRFFDRFPKFIDVG